MNQPLERRQTSAEENQDKYFGIDLASIESILQLYCRALTGKEVDICHGEADSILAYRNVWWSQLTSGHTPDSQVRVSLPASFMNYSTYDENFSWYKSSVTQQVGHVEFGSFDFIFDKKSTLFENLRFNMKSVVNADVSPVAKFLYLFDDRLLAAQTFIAVENIRVNHLVKHFYPGVKHSYVQMQQDVVLSLQHLPGMTLRRAFCEMLEVLEFDETATTQIDALFEPLQMAKEVIGKLYSPAATVEDSAEATIRIYEIARKIPRNMSVSSSGGYNSENREPNFSDLEAQEYIGNFQADQVKLNMEMRNNPGQSSTMPMTAEDLQKLGDQKVGIRDISEAQFLSSTGLSVADLPRGVHIYQFSQTKYQQVGRYQPKDAGLPITPEEGEKLFNYEEWDFRAKHYLPEWCCIREKVLGEGSSYFYEKTLESQKILAAELKRQFEKLPAELLYKAKNLDDGDEYDLDLVINELLDKRAGHTPSGKVYWKKKKIQRDVAVVFLLDMSGSTADLISKS
ncbi:MAG: hypothetical protein NT082_03155, partial [Chloroflexi bacterium]|nr:hypothetical protein [Chloroflexota bacterium]